MEIKSKSLVINDLALHTLIRLGCPDEIIFNYIKTGSFEETNDPLINIYLENLILWEV